MSCLSIGTLLSIMCRYLRKRFRLLRFCFERERREGLRTSNNNPSSFFARFSQCFLVASHECLRSLHEVAKHWRSVADRLLRFSHYIPMLILKKLQLSFALRLVKTWKKEGKAKKSSKKTFCKDRHEIRFFSGSSRCCGSKEFQSFVWTKQFEEFEFRFYCANTEKSCQKNGHQKQGELRELFWCPTVRSFLANRGEFLNFFLSRSCRDARCSQFTRNNFRFVFCSSGNASETFARQFSGRFLRVLISERNSGFDWSRQKAKKPEKKWNRRRCSCITRIVAKFN